MEFQKGNQSQHVVIPFAILEDKQELLLMKEGKKKSCLFYHIQMNFVMQDDSVVAANYVEEENGFSIWRNYFKNGKEIPLESDSEVTCCVGDRLTVRLALKTMMPLRHVLLEDFIPAGFEVENPVIRNIPIGEGSILESNEETLSHMNDLPFEIIMEIFSYFSPAELCRLERVCKRWKA